MKTEHLILIALGCIAAIWGLFRNEIPNGPERLILLEHKVEILEEAHTTTHYHNNAK